MGSGEFFFFEERGVNRNGALFWVHQAVGRSDAHDDEEHHHDVVRIEDSLGHRHWCREGTVCGLDEGFARSGHGEGNGAREACMPDDEAAIGRGDEQAVVDATELARNLFGEDDADNEAETPVEPAGKG